MCWGGSGLSILSFGGESGIRSSFRKGAHQAAGFYHGTAVQG